MHARCFVTCLGQWYGRTLEPLVFEPAYVARCKLCFFFEPDLLSLDVAPCWTVHPGEY